MRPEDDDAASLADLLFEELAPRLARWNFDVPEDGPTLAYEPCRQPTGELPILVRVTKEDVGHCDSVGTEALAVYLRMNGAYGSDGAAWARPRAIVPGRLLKLGAQVSF